MDFQEIIRLLMRTGTVEKQCGRMGPDVAAYLRKLQRPGHCVDAVIDTDADNEIDDQYAIAYALKLPEQLRIRAFYAAPFVNTHAPTPDLGMAASLREIHHVLALAGEDHYPVLRGSGAYLPDEQTPVDSEAARDLVRRAMERDPEDPLYVVAIAALTNVASALLLEPRIAERIVIIWHGGTSFDQPLCNSFNACQDIAATRVVMNSGAPMILQPGKGVAGCLTTTGPELDAWLRGKNALCDYLVERTYAKAQEWHRKGAWSHALFDVAAFTWFLTDKCYMEDRLEPMPLIDYDAHYVHEPGRHLVSYVYSMNRDAILTDLFERISR